MGKTQAEQLELAQQVVAATQYVTVGADYWHYKSRDKIYEVVDLGFVEATNELCVIYRAKYGKRLTFIRPLSIWLETLEQDGKQVPRFQRV